MQAMGMGVCACKAGRSGGSTQAVRACCTAAHSSALPRAALLTVLPMPPALYCLQIIHANVIDTSVLYPHPRGPPFKSALRVLASRHLLRTIQQGEPASAAVQPCPLLPHPQCYPSAGRVFLSTCSSCCVAAPSTSDPPPRVPCCRPGPASPLTLLLPLPLRYSALCLPFLTPCPSLRLPLLSRCPCPALTPPLTLPLPRAYPSSHPAPAAAGEHNPVEDARAAMDLALLKFEKGPAYGAAAGERGDRLLDVLGEHGR